LLHNNYGKQLHFGVVNEMYYSYKVLGPVHVYSVYSIYYVSEW